MTQFLKSSRRSQYEIQDSLLKAVDAVVDAVDGGDSPTDALTKVARSHQLTSPLIDHVAHAYNVGAQNAQREQASGNLEKFASLPLADAEAAKAAVFPEVKSAHLRPIHQLKTAGASSEYAESAAWLSGLRSSQEILQKTAQLRKTASTAAPAPLSSWPAYAKPALLVHADAVHKQAHRVDASRRECLRLETQLKIASTRINEYFKLADAQPMEAVETHAAHRYGDTLGGLFDAAMSDLSVSRRHKRAGGFSKIAASTTPNWNAEPYRSIQEAVELREQLTTQVAQWQSLKEAEVAMSQAAENDLKAKKKRSILLPPIKTAAQSPTPPKKPSGDGGMGNMLSRSKMLATAMPNALEVNLPDPQKKTDSRLMELEDPGVETELRAAKSKSLLTDMLANDDVISRHDPETVVKAYNEISELAPALATLPGYVRPQLRNWLSSNIQPFDAGEAIKLNRQSLVRTPTPGR